MVHLGAAARLRTAQKTYVPFAACGGCDVGHHNLWVPDNEPGLYDVLLGSHKEEAVLAIC